jgi:hypothetical protein
VVGGGHHRLLFPAFRYLAGKWSLPEPGGVSLEGVSTVTLDQADTRVARADGTPPPPAPPVTEPVPAEPTVQTKETIPFWLAVSLTVMFILPLGLYFGQFNLPLWVAFIVWAEYFALGGKPANITTIIPAYSVGVFWGVCMILLYTWIAPHMTGASVYPMYIALFVGVSVMVFVMKYVKLFNTGSLAYFNGLSMLLAVYFVGAHPTFSSNPYVLVALAGAYALAGGYLGWFIGWFNVTITFPRKVVSRVAHAAHS